MMWRSFFYKYFLVIALALLTLNHGECQSESREHRELRMADQAVLASIAVSRSPKGQHLCVENKLACVGPDRAELALALIGARDSSGSRSALTDLLSYRLDGSVAEDYSCYVLKAGRSIKPDLLAINAEALADRCHNELDRLTRSRKESFDGLDQGAVCADPDTIRKKATQLADGISKGTKCTAEDF